MSFDQNNNKALPISRNNYEEYFLLYVDNELDATERTWVEQFLQAHPDLQPELDLLLNTRIPTQELSFLNKDLLLAHHMKENVFDESLLLYVDKELNIEAVKVLEEKLQTDTALQWQYQMLLKTRLDASEEVAYPNKKELYRKERNHKFLPWLRVAALFILLAGLGSIVIYRQNFLPVSQADQPWVSLSNKQTQLAAPAVIPFTQGDKQKGLDTKAPNSTFSNKQVPIWVHKPATAKTPKVNSGKEEENATAKTENSLVTLSGKELLLNPKADGENHSSQPIVNHPVVTYPDSISYTSTEDIPATPDYQNTLVQGRMEKKSSLKNLLRKATRFIERQTNITVTNENNELLISALAIKL